MGLVEEIKEKIRIEIINFFDNNEISYKQKDNDFRSLMLLLLNIDRKWIPPKPRKVFISNDLEMKMNTFDTHIPKNEIEHFRTEFQNGVNINNHMSKNIFWGDKNDLLLDHWGIHHLHLNLHSALQKSDMDNNRSDYYLLFLIDDCAVYFIDVVKHLLGDEFANTDFLKIIINNGWHNLVPLIEVTDIIKPNNEAIDNSTVFQSWRSKANQLTICIEGKCYSSGRFVALSGDSMEDIRTVNNFERCLYDDLLSVENIVIKKASIMKEDYILSLIVTINGFPREYKIIGDCGANRCVII